MRTLLILTLPVSLYAETLTLAQAMDRAAQVNPEVQLARLRTLESEILAARSRSALRPQLTGTLQSTYQVTNLAGIGLVFPGLDNRIGPYSTFAARPALTQTLFDAALRSETRAARERSRQSAEDAAAVRELVLGAVAQTYLQTLETEARLHAAEARVATAEAIRRQVSERVDAGQANRLDLARASEQVERERTLAAYARRDRNVLLTQLARLMGSAASGELELAPIDVADAPEPATNRAEMRSLLVRGQVLESELQRARRERWPKASVLADFGAFGATPASSVSTYMVAGTLAVPLYTGGRIENDIKAASTRLEQWRQERRQLELAIAQEIAQARAERAAAQQARGHAEAAAAQARESLSLSRLRYEAGLVTNLDVVTAQQNVAQLEEESIRAATLQSLAQARLAQAHGDIRAFLTPGAK